MKIEIGDRLLRTTLTERLMVRKRIDTCPLEPRAVVSPT